MATAFKKWGLTNTFVAAEILRDTILGVDNPAAETFRALRSRPIKSIPSVMKKYLGG